MMNTYFYTVRKITYPSLLRRGMVYGERPLLPEILGQPVPVGAKSPVFSRYSLIRDNTNMKSTTHFPTSLRWTLYVTSTPSSSPPLLTPRGVCFTSKIALYLKKVCYKVSLCENCQRQSCMAFIGLSMRKWLVGEIPFCIKIWRILTHPLAKHRFSIYFRCRASAVTPGKNRKSTTRFPMSLTWTSYVAPISPHPQGGLKTQKMLHLFCR